MEITQSRFLHPPGRLSWQRPCPFLPRCPWLRAIEGPHQAPGTESCGRRDGDAPSLLPCRGVLPCAVRWTACPDPEPPSQGAGPGGRPAPALSLHKVRGMDPLAAPSSEVAATLVHLVLATTQGEGPAVLCAKSLQSCATLCDPVACSPPGSSVHGILQAGILERAATPSPAPFVTGHLSAHRGCGAGGGALTRAVQWASCAHGTECQAGPPVRG